MPVNANDVVCPRIRMSLNREWQYRKGDFPEAADCQFNDSDWERICLPHSFSLPYFLAPRFFVGYGWYRKTLEVLPEWRGKRLLLEFEAVFQVAEVFVNGSAIGVHKGGYTGFEYDITAAVKPGSNTVAVRVNNLWSPVIAPRAGEHVFSGGIYRNVWLNVVDPLHVTWYGTFVTTPAISEQRAVVKVATEITNCSADARCFILETELLAPDGRRIGIIQSEVTISSGMVVTVEQVSDDIAQPQLWSPDTPVLYAALSRIYCQGKLTDAYRTEFGIRWFEWSTESGFFLNGKPCYFRGVNVHQDRAGWGDAVADSGFLRDVRYMKEAGFTMIRGSHYPHAPAFATACDRVGMLFWSENCFWGTGGFKGDGDWNSPAYPPRPEDEKPFEDSVRSSLREMIRIHRNHPSIVVWSMCNEVFFCHPETLRRVREFLKELVDYSRELDPTRPVAIGGCQRGDLDRCADIAGYNGDGARLQEYQNPGIANCVSEYGSVIADRPGQFAPGHTDGINGTPCHVWRSGEMLWCGFDHGSTGGRFGWMGAMDYFRLPKNQYYWYRKNYAGKKPDFSREGTPAALRLTADKLRISPCDGTDDVQLTVTVVDDTGNWLNDTPEITVRVLEGPGELPTGRAITFSHNSDIAIRDGKCAIDMRAHYAGSIVVEASAKGVHSARIVIESADGPAYEEGKTCVVETRRYVRYEPEASPAPDTSASGMDDIALNKPTRTSGDAPGHSSSLAVDGNDDTFWLADRTGAGTWYQVTPERFVAIESIELLFPRQGMWRYRIENTVDGENWGILTDQSDSQDLSALRRHSFRHDNMTLAVRIIFTGLPAGRAAALSALRMFSR